ncbi:hypothetical protein D031_1592B, partial [Vibrio parahaemolyticus VP-48]
RTMVRLQG